jgi:hypothetical protein
MDGEQVNLLPGQSQRLMHTKVMRNCIYVIFAFIAIMGMILTASRAPLMEKFLGDFAQIISLGDESDEGCKVEQEVNALEKQDVNDLTANDAWYKLLTLYNYTFKYSEVAQKTVHHQKICKQPQYQFSEPILKETLTKFFKTHQDKSKITEVQVKKLREDLRLDILINASSHQQRKLLADNLEALGNELQVGIKLKWCAKHEGCQDWVKQKPQAVSDFFSLSDKWLTPPVSIFGELRQDWAHVRDRLKEVDQQLFGNMELSLMLLKDDYFDGTGLMTPAQEDGVSRFAEEFAQLQKNWTELLLLETEEALKEKQPPFASCQDGEDSHVQTFDGRHVDYYSNGDYYIVKSDMISIQGRSLPTRFSSGLAVTKFVAIGGSLLKNNTLIIGASTAKWNKNPILTKFPDQFIKPGLVTVDYGNVTEPSTERTVTVKIVECSPQRPKGVVIQVKRWTFSHESEYITWRISMHSLRRKGGQDGHCGNFNGDETDDDRVHRRGKKLVPTGDDVLFERKTPDIDPNRYDIDDCPAAILEEAKEKCKKRFFSYSCMAVHCGFKDDKPNKEDAKDGNDEDVKPNKEDAEDGNDEDDKPTKEDAEDGNDEDDKPNKEDAEDGNDEAEAADTFKKMQEVGNSFSKGDHWK